MIHPLGLNSTTRRSYLELTVSALFQYKGRCVRALLAGLLFGVGPSVSSEFSSRPYGKFIGLIQAGRRHGRRLGLDSDRGVARGSLLGLGNILGRPRGRVRGNQLGRALGHIRGKHGLGLGTPRPIRRGRSTTLGHRTLPVATRIIRTAMDTTRLIRATQAIRTRRLVPL